jgi:CheY-like chemotaxis protein
VLADRIAEGGGTSAWPPTSGNDGSAALTKGGLTAYDVVVLDRDLPVVHGDQVRRTPRRRGPPGS